MSLRPGPGRPRRAGDPGRAGTVVMTQLDSDSGSSVFNFKLKFTFYFKSELKRVGNASRIMTQ
jgi:hypothetical protein